MKGKIQQQVKSREKLLKEIAEYGDFWEIRRTIRSGVAIGTLIAPKRI